MNKKITKFEYNDEAIKFTQFWMKRIFNCMTKESKIRANSFDEIYGKPITIAPFEKPDMFVLFEKSMFILEHFRFDSSKSKRNSSLLQEEKNLFLNKDKSDNIKFKKIINESSIEYYKENLLRVTNNHLEKYNSYIENVQTKGGVIINEVSYEFSNKNKEFGFITEDISLDYNMYKKNNELKYITPFHIKEFRDIIRANNHIKHFFHLVYDSSENEVTYYFHNENDNIDKLDAIMEYTSPTEIEKATVYLWKNEGW